MNVARDQLRSFVERIERLEEEKKGAGERHPRCPMRKPRPWVFDVRALRQIVKERGLDSDARDEFEAILDTYRAALGMLPGDERQADAAGEDAA